MTISGSCIFNGKLYEKSKEEMVLGIYLEQYQKLTEVIADQKEIKQSIRMMLQFERRKIITKFLEVTKVKTGKIVEKARTNPNEHHRFRARQQPLEEIFANLAEMGVTR